MLSHNTYGPKCHPGTLFGPPGFGTRDPPQDLLFQKVLAVIQKLGMILLFVELLFENARTYVERNSICLYTRALERT